jgi:hypothetical protein
VAAVVLEGSVWYLVFAVLVVMVRQPWKATRKAV